MEQKVHGCPYTTLQQLHKDYPNHYVLLGEPVSENGKTVGGYLIAAADTDAELNNPVRHKFQRTMYFHTGIKNGTYPAFYGFNVSADTR